LRRLGQIDAVLATLLSRPVGETPPAARALLRLGLTQLLFLGTPPHAVVDTAVTLAHRRRPLAPPALINAVLRRAASAGGGLIEGHDAPRLNTPDWLWQAWTKAYGAETCRQIAAQHLETPPLDLTARDDPHAVAGALGGIVMPTGSVRLERAGVVTELAGYAEGAWWVQDAAAALPARLLGDVRGLRVIDLCAAPGGKTAQLAAAGAEVIAIDAEPARLVRVAENLARLRLKAELIAADASTWVPPAPADAVLIDAPCSATGTIRRHPDVPWLKAPTDLTALNALQDRLLAAAVRMVRPGGRIVYCVCSLQDEEGPARTAAFVHGGAPVQPLPVTADEIGGLDALVTADGALRTLPCHLAAAGGLDGFFAMRFTRV
ncbi:MAG: RsmB/NOP family class I SAM-dependent RNA methyltransferase, partial [Defluviicoccus sp.]|nr:RsmB/NOP family class I SAM-dependent RNA methyltransferase [Defluviicoccus sp.]